MKSKLVIAKENPKVLHNSRVPSSVAGSFIFRDLKLKQRKTQIALLESSLLLTFSIKYNKHCAACYGCKKNYTHCFRIGNPENSLESYEKIRIKIKLPQ